MNLAQLILLVNGINALRKNCEAEKIFTKILEKENDRRDAGTKCDKVNFQLHNLCSFILATTFKMRYVQIKKPRNKNR